MVGQLVVSSVETMADCLAGYWAGCLVEHSVDYLAGLLVDLMD